MGKYQEERKTPVIVVKKRRTFSPPSLSEKTDIIAPVFTEQTAESAPAGINSSAVETHIPEAPARKKKKKRHRFPRPSHWTREYTHECVEKIKALFPHLRAEGGGFIPLKIGINNDISAFLAEHPETELTMDEWLCAVSCITSAAYICSGQLSPASHVMAWMVTPKGRSQTLKHRVPVADWRH